MQREFSRTKTERMIRRSLAKLEPSVTMDMTTNDTDNNSIPFDAGTNQIVPRVKKRAKILLIN